MVQRFMESALSRVGVQRSGLAVALAAAIVCGSAQPALAFLPPVGSPPGWQSYWVTATQASNLYDSAQSTQALSAVGSGTYYRVDAPSQVGRFWVYNPLTDGWGWLPKGDTKPSRAPTTEELEAILNPPPPDPHTYLYQRWPNQAARMDCVIGVESTWNPSARNPRSGAAGLAQFMPATWARTPQGQAGKSVYDAYANIDAFGWMVEEGGGSWYEWSAVSLGYC